MKLITYKGLEQLLVTEDNDSRRLHNTVVKNCIIATKRQSDEKKNRGKKAPGIGDVIGVKSFWGHDEAMEKIRKTGFCHVASVYFEGYEIQYIIEK